MRDVNQANPQPQESIFQRPAYMRAVLQQGLDPVQAARVLGVARFMVGERRQGLSTFVLRELMPALEHHGVESVYLPMKGFPLQDPALRLKRALGWANTGRTASDLPPEKIDRPGGFH